jgi:hypothetical protein
MTAVGERGGGGGKATSSFQRHCEPSSSFDALKLNYDWNKYIKISI